MGSSANLRLVLKLFCDFVSIMFENVTGDVSLKFCPIFDIMLLSIVNRLKLAADFNKSVKMIMICTRANMDKREFATEKHELLILINPNFYFQQNRVYYSKTV